MGSNLGGEKINDDHDPRRGRTCRGLFGCRTDFSASPNATGAGSGAEAMITLPVGTHKLQLVLGDWSHIPHAPPLMSNVITVTVR